MPQNATRSLARHGSLQKCSPKRDPFKSGLQSDAPQEYGGLSVDQARRLKELEGENTRLKKLVAEQALDISILKEAATGNY